MGINVAAPHVNQSETDFGADVAASKIFFGLSAIKGVGVVPTEEIIRERNERGPYKDFYDFTQRVNHKIVNKKTTEGLVKSAAFDGLGAGRKAMIENLESFVEGAKRKQGQSDRGQSSFFDLAAAANFSVKPVYSNGETDEYPERELQAMEYSLLGLFVNNHPMHAVRELSSVLAKHSILDFTEDSIRDGAKVSFTALITEFEKKITKSKKIIAIVNFEDLQGRIEGVLFSSKLNAFEHLLEKGKRLLVEGTLSKHSEGDMSVLVDNLKDIDNMGIIDFELELNPSVDLYRLLHAVKALCLKTEHQGGYVPVLKLIDRASGEVTRLSLGPKFAIANNEFVIKAIRDQIVSVAVSQDTVVAA
jgi:DNA polymerase-3 subunit alpha